MRFDMRPGKTADGQLSLKALAPEMVPTIPRLPPAVAVKLDPAWPARQLRQVDDLTKVPLGGGIILIHLRGLGARTGNGLTLMRMGPDSLSPPSVADKRPDVLVASIGNRMPDKEGTMFAFVAPAGRWRIGAFGFFPALYTCFGAPGFELKPGEAVFAGSLDLSAMGNGPDMDLAIAKAWLGSQPAAEILRPAQWVNGLQGACAGHAIYALEFKGAPFAPGYSLGSMASGAP
jgi:hypothetical protein